MNPPDDIWVSIWKPAIQQYQKDTGFALKYKFDPVDSKDAEAILHKIENDFVHNRQKWQKLRDVIKPVLFAVGALSEAVAEGTAKVCSGHKILTILICISSCVQKFPPAKASSASIRLLVQVSTTGSQCITRMGEQLLVGSQGCQFKS